MENKYKKLQEFCKFLDSAWRYIAKDKSGTTHIYGTKPHKKTVYWDSTGDCAYTKINNQETFDCLSWDDEQPYDIETGKLAKGDEEFKYCHCCGQKLED